jgi:hypothetical protein
MKVTRDVVSDLWPLYAAGEASADTRSLVEEFLAGDPAFAALLRDEPRLSPEDVTLPADHEAKALERTREMVQGGGLVRAVRLVAVTLTVLAIVRLPADSAENIWPRVFVAALAWALYGALAWRQRRGILRSTRPGGK